MKDRRLITNVSDAFWCSIVNGVSQFSPAEITLDDHRERVSWLDRMFEGGIRIPEAAGRPLTMLLTGPPGSGKSTLAMEMSYRMRWSPPSPSEGLFRLFISLESESQRLIDNAVNIGFPGAPSGIVQCDGRRIQGDVLAVWGRERMDRLRAGQPARRDPPWVLKMGQSMLEYAAQGALPPQFIEHSLEGVSRAAAVVRSKKKSRLLDPRKAYKVMAKSIPEVLVIDSLNVIGAENQPRFFEQFLSSVPKETKLVIFVLDAAPGSGAHPNWEFVCDIVVRMGYESVHNYYTRTVEVVKARYQGHVWGKHQLKIYAKPALPEKNDPDRTDKMLRAHPYRDQGGIFVFPSLHYYLSLYKRRAPEDDRSGTRVEGVDPGCRGLADAVTFPKGRCTAFIGVRGGHKSHLAYLHLLNRIVSAENEAALVISLREDEQRSYSTMQRILREEMDRPDDDIRHYQSRNQLEVLYYHPGYITPEEFFHRMFISIQRLKQSGKRSLTVMFNSLDQLGAKFPLCARQDGFVAGIIEALAGEHATSIFIAVDEPGQPAEQYGLLATADLILSFYPYTFTEHEYRQHLLDPERRRRLARRDRLSKSAAQRIKRDEIVLQVVRYAGGIRAGARGLLELVDDPSKSLHAKQGLHFTRLNPRGFAGTPVLDRTGSKSAAPAKE